jgi:hypothetical protein
MSTFFARFCHPYDTSNATSEAPARPRLVVICTTPFEPREP